MSDEPTRLSGKACMVLKCIAQGLSYEQILSKHPVLTYPDIFDAAREALGSSDVTGGASGRKDIKSKSPGFASAREKYPRAFTAWNDDDDARIRELQSAGKSVADIAVAVQRSTLGVQARMVKLGLIRPEDAPGLAQLRRKRSREREMPGGQSEERT